MSLSPSKANKQESLKQLLTKMPYVEQLPDGKLVCSIVQKQSSSGCFDNERLLVLNGKDGTIGYSNIFPKQVPLNSFDNVKYIKKSTLVAQAEISKNKNNHKAIEIKCKTYLYRKKTETKNEKWVFKFKTITAATEMMNHLLEAQKHFSSPQVQLKQEAAVVNQNQISYYPQQNNTPPSNGNLNIIQPPIIYPNNPQSQIRQNRPYYDELNHINNQQQKIYSFGSRQDQRKDNIQDVEEIKNKVSSKLIESRYKQEEQTDYKRPNNKSSRYKLQEQENNNYNYNNHNMKSSQKVPNTPPKLDFSNLKNSIHNDFNQTQPNYSKYNLSSSKKQDKYGNRNQRQSSIDHIKEMFPPYQQSNSRDSKQINPMNPHDIRQSINYIPASRQNLDYIQQDFPPVRNMTQSLKRSNQISRSSHKKRTDEYNNWNKQMYFSTNPISTLVKFKKEAQIIVKDIIDSYTIKSNHYVPVHQQQASTIYDENNMIIMVGISQRDQTFSLETQDNLMELFNDNFYLSSYLSCQDNIQIPLLSLVQYKGIVSLVKAKIIDSKMCDTQQIHRQLDRLEATLGVGKQELMRSKYRVVHYNNSNVVYIDTVDKLFSLDNQAVLPELMRLFAQNQSNYKRSARGKRREDEILIFKNKQMDQLIKSLEESKQIILNARDMENVLCKYGIDHKSLNFLYFRTQLRFLQNLIATQVAAEEAKNMLSFHIQRKIRTINKQSRKNNGYDNSTEDELRDTVHQLMDNLCSHTKNSEELWSVMIKDIKAKWGINIETDKSDINWGYFIGALIYKLKLKIDINLLDKNKRFGKQKKCIHEKFITGFEMSSRTTTVASPEINKLWKLLEYPEQVTHKNIKFILDNQEILEHTQYHSNFKQIIMLLASFLKINDSVVMFEQFFVSEPPSTTSVQLETLKIKHFLSSRAQQKAITIFQNLCELISFWGGEFHPLLSILYDIFVEYYLANRQYKDAISLCKSSIVNTAKLVGNQVSLARKYRRLGDILSESSKSNQALPNYIKARDILLVRAGSHSFEVGEIQYKIGLKHFQNSNLTDSIQSLKKALKIISEKSDDDILLHIFSTLNTIYENQSQFEQLKENSISCFERLFNLQDVGKYSQMLRIAVLPFIIELDEHRRQSLKQILGGIRFQYSQEEYHRYLMEQVDEQNVLEEFVNIMRRVDRIRQQMKHQRRSGPQKYEIRENNRSYLESKSKSFKQEHKVDIIRDVSLLEAIAGIIEYQYIAHKIQQYNN